MTNCSDENVSEEVNPFFDDNSRTLANPEPILTIGKVAKQYKVTLRTLRFYEANNLLHPLRKGTTRFYRSHDCRLLETILRGKQLGYTLAEINRLIQPSHDQTTVTDLESNLSSEQMLSQIGILEKRRDDLDRAISALHRAQESRAAFANA